MFEVFVQHLVKYELWSPSSFGGGVAASSFKVMMRRNEKPRRLQRDRGLHLSFHMSTPNSPLANDSSRRTA